MADIQPTDEATSFRIYHDSYPSSKGDPDVGCLLAVLGYMPFAVTLVAKLGMEGSTAKELLDAWRRSGDILFDKREESMNRSISLSVESDLVKRNPNAVTLLFILLLLPAGTTKQNLHWWAPDSAIQTSMIPSAIATLSKAALLVQNKLTQLECSSWSLSSSRLCSSKAGSRRKSGSRYNCLAVNMS
jgi:hypothetical protein